MKTLVNQGAPELVVDGAKAMIPVQTTKANMNPYKKATVLLALRMEKRLLRSEIRVPPWTGTCFAGSAMGGA